MADRVGNPISWLGRWSAAECLRSLGKAFKLSEPSDFPFGATGRKFALPTYFAWPLQSYPDSVANRGGIAGSPSEAEGARRRCGSYSNRVITRRWWLDADRCNCGRVCRTRPLLRRSVRKTANTCRFGRTPESPCASDDGASERRIIQTEAYGLHKPIQVRGCRSH